MFRARIIDANEAMTVFGLVRLCYPDIEIDAWRQHLQGLGGGKRRKAGCLVVSDQRGYVHAACLFRVTPDPMSGRRMELSYLSKAELPAAPHRTPCSISSTNWPGKKHCSTIVIEEAVTRLADGPLTQWGDLDQALAAHQFRRAASAS